MIEIIIFSLAVIYGLYKWRKTKSDSILYGIILATSLYLVKTFNMPTELGFSLWAFFGFFVLLYKSLQKKIEKSMYVFSIMFLGFGIVFLLQAIAGMGHQDYIVKLLRF